MFSRLIALSSLCLCAWAPVFWTLKCKGSILNAPVSSVLLVLLPADLHSSSSSREFWPGSLKAGGGRWTRRLLQALPAQHTLHRITQGTTQIAQNTLHTQHTATHIEQNGWSLGADQLQLWIS